MNKIYYLSTCNTCKRILGELELPDDIALQEVKTEALTEAQLDAMKALSGTYESLFNRRSQLYRKQGLAEKSLSETDYRALILSHYTFLKRPVIIAGDKIFIGNSKKVVAAAKQAIHG